ncbi:sulfotransferase 6B1-like [Protopterus annectens]|uniref:sulfotransferase 6B1-like n=1 Tax=Protopterus annectens TaxID=7888 RepID=UPI001CFB9D16|nr:sulfotransferase 6B1-like [Protopterus annectens]
METNIAHPSTELILVFRNPKDTAVSYYHFHQTNPGLVSYNGWDEFFPKFMAGEVCWGSYFEYAAEWEKHIEDENLLVITFEELKQNLYEGVKSLAAFLGFSLNEEQLQSITKKGDFQAMKSKSQEKNPSLVNIFYRKGEVGDWRNYFSEAQNLEMDAMFEKYLAGTKLGKKLQYDVYCK